MTEVKTVEESKQPPAAEGPEAAKNHVNNFLMTTTAHGFYRVGESRRRPLRRIIWLFVIVTTMAGCAGHLGLIISRYFSYPMVSKQYQETGRAIFPDVTICHNSPISGALAGNKIPSLGNKTFNDLAVDVHRFWSCIVADRIALHGSQENQAILIDKFVRSTLLGYAYEAGVTQDVMSSLIFCDKGKSECNYSEDFTTSFDPLKWSCQTYKSRVQPQDSTRGTELEVTLFQDPSNLQYEMASQTALRDTVKGATVIIHAPGTIPIGSEHEVNIGSEIVINVRMTNFTEETTPKNLCRDPNEVLTVSENGQPKKYLYSQVACQQLSLQRNIWESCGCLSEELPVPYDPKTIPNNASRCHALTETIVRDIFKADCVNSSAENRCYVSLSKYASLEMIFARVRCHEKTINDWVINPVVCESRCFREEYQCSSNNFAGTFRPIDNRIVLLAALERKQRELSTGGKSTRLIDAKIAAANANYIKFSRLPEFPADFQNIRVDLTSVMGNRVDENAAYPIGILFSDIGGVLGLWVGCSIITLLEISELSINIANNAASKTRKHIKFGTLARTTAMWRSHQRNRAFVPQRASSTTAQLPVQLAHVEEMQEKAI